MTRIEFMAMRLSSTGRRPPCRTYSVIASIEGFMRAEVRVPIPALPIAFVRRTMIPARFERDRTIPMTTYETSATVEEDGQLHVTGVPFAPGARVDVVVSPKVDRLAGDEGESPVSRLARLFDALDKARNLKSVGALRRDELYDRNGLH